MSTKIKIKPLFDRVLIKPMTDENENKTKSGIYLAGDTKEEGLNKGIVVEVGMGRLKDDGTFLKPSVKVDDKVFFSKYSAEEIVVDDEKYFILREENIFAVMEPFGKKN